MRRSILACAALLAAAACAEPTSPPAPAPGVNANIFTEPPPPPVGGFLPGTFIFNSAATSRASRLGTAQVGKLVTKTFVFSVPAIYNRSQTTGRAWVESKTAPWWWISYLNGVTTAVGKVIAIDSVTNDRWTVDISQSAGTHQIFGPCAVPAPQCLGINWSYTGTIEVWDVNRWTAPQPVTGSFRFIW